MCSQWSHFNSNLITCRYVEASELKYAQAAEEWEKEYGQYAASDTCPPEWEKLLKRNKAGGEDAGAQKVEDEAPAGVLGIGAAGATAATAGGGGTAAAENKDSGAGAAAGDPGVENDKKVCLGHNLRIEVSIAVQSRMQQFSD